MNTPSAAQSPEKSENQAGAMATLPSAEDVAKALETLRQLPEEYRVLNHLRATDHLCDDDGSPKLTLMVLDTETTGLEAGVDKMIEIGYAMVEFSPETGKAYRVLDRVCELEDPGFPLEEITTKLTGLTDADVSGKTFNRTKINADIARADLVMAHNSNFDRKMMEVDFPAMQSKQWVCSMANGPWEEMDINTKKLEFLAFAVGNFFYKAHRAMTDTNAVVALLNKPGPDGKTILQHILEKGNEPTFTVWATGSAFETKDTLKANGYRWCGDPDEKQFKAWFKPGVKDVDGEMAWLGENIYTRPARISVDLILPEDAFSGRFSERQPIDVEPVRKSTPRP